jgi:hypothetical protein
MEVQLRKELLEAKHRLAELEPAWEMFIAKHNEDEEAKDLESGGGGATCRAKTSKNQK